MAASNIAVAGPWVDDQPGHGFVALSYSRYSADSYFAGPGQIDIAQKPVSYGNKLPIQVPYGTQGFGNLSYASNYVAQDASLYGEVSMLRGLAAVLSLPLYRFITQDVASTKPAQLTNGGAGDLILGLKYQIPRIRALRGFAFGPQLFLTMPTGDQNGRAPYPTGANAPTGPMGYVQAPLPMPTGNGTVDIEARGSFGYSFYPIPVFVAADIGYHHHFDKASCSSNGVSDSVRFSDDLPWNVQIGATWGPKKKWFDHGTLIAMVHGTKSFENGDVPGKDGLPVKSSPYLQTCGQSNNMSYLSAGAMLMLFPIRWIGVTYSIEHTLTGGNTGYGLTNMVGLATEF